ncbi:uncharacterized protein V6R79_023912 [Siganus canaliculatus]
MRAGRPVDVQDRHRLQTPAVDGAEVETFSVQIYACQGRTSLENRNAAIAVRSSRFPHRRLGSVLKTS